MNTIRSSSTTATNTALKKKPAFDVQAFLDSSGATGRCVEYRKIETIYAQGDSATRIYYIQKGTVKLTVVNKSGKEAVVALLGPGDFLGEGCLAGRYVCMGTAITMTPTTLLVIEKRKMVRLLHTQHEFSDHFMAFLLARNIRIEQDLADQLFNSSEKRLARTLLLLARYGMEDQPHKLVARISQETLAEMIGTTRGRVNFFMNKFKKLGFINYDHGLHINTSLLDVVLHE